MKLFLEVFRERKKREGEDKEKEMRCREFDVLSASAGSTSSTSSFAGDRRGVRRIQNLERAERS